MSGFNSSPSASPGPESVSSPDHVLGLTVHTLPTPQQALQSQAQRTRQGRLRMLAVLLVCAAPVLVSYLTYYLVRPEGRRNFGQLIEPQRPLPALIATRLDGQPQDLRLLKGQWLFISVAPALCDSACEQRLYMQRQLREALGKDKDRLDWVWLVAGSEPVPARLLPGLAQATVLRVDERALGRWLEPASGQQLADHLYLVDPLGNWMMRYPPLNSSVALDTASATGIKRDLERLMRATSSWDRPGRP